MRFHFILRYVIGLLAALMLVAGELAPTRADVVITQTQGPRGVTVYKMTVTPAAEASPAFRYRLMARDLDLVPGNAVPFYYRAMMNIGRTFESLRREFGERWDDWYVADSATPIARLPRDQVRKAIEMSRTHIEEQLAQAAIRRDCDWQLGVSEMRGPEIIALLLPEIQDSRQLSRLLSLRTRLAIAEGRTDDALNFIRMNYRLATDIARPPLLVCGLVGVAETSMANATVLELIAQPGSPNLYWALTELPQPFIDLRNATRFEVDMPARAIPFIHNAETTQRSPEEWNRLYSEAFRNAHQMTMSSPLQPGTALAWALMGYSHAKKKLIEQGLDRQRVEQMPVGQVIAIYTERNSQRWSDDNLRLSFLPFSQARKVYAEVENRSRSDLRYAGPLSGADDRELLPMISHIVPSLFGAREAQVRIDRDVAAMRVIEALRLYAAAHDSKLPERLNQISEVSVPLNPATDQPFAYRLDGETGVLELPLTDGIRYSKRFEITIEAK